LENKKSVYGHLGLIFDQNMKWHLHINKMAMQCNAPKDNYVQDILSEANNFARNYAYCEFISLLLQYSIIDWNGTYENGIKPLTI